MSSISKSRIILILARVLVTAVIVEGGNILNLVRVMMTPLAKNDSSSSNRNGNGNSGIL